MHAICSVLVLVPALAFFAVADARADVDSALPSSAPGAVVRANPRTDGHVTTLLNQQVAAVRRVAATQIANLQGRLQALHGDDAACDRAGVQSLVGAPTSQPRRVQGGTPILAAPVATPVSLPLALCQRGDSATAWTAGSLQVGANDMNAGGREFGFHSHGVTFGTDSRLRDDLTLGLGVGLAHEQADAASDGTANAADALSATGYLSYQPSEALYVDAMAGYGALKMQSARRVDERGLIAADRRGSEWFASLAAAGQLRVAGADIAPYTRVDALRATLRGYRDADASADALQFARQSVPSLNVAVGVAGSSRIETPFGFLSPRSRVEWRHELDRADLASIRYADDLAGQAYAQDPIGSARDSLSVSLGATLAMRDRWSVGAGYAFDYSSNTRVDRFDLTLSVQFR